MSAEGEGDYATAPADTGISSGKLSHLTIIPAQPTYFRCGRRRRASSSSQLCPSNHCAEM